MTRVFLIGFLINIALAIYAWVKISETSFRSEKTKTIIYVLGLLLPLFGLLFLYLLKDERPDAGRDESQSR
jgi:heme/copper-type cytochrome/quinol oxidase subunit 4